MVARYTKKLWHNANMVSCVLESQSWSLFSGGSRISRRGGVHPLGGVDLWHGHFLVKMYAKMKELGPIGGVHPAHPLDPPMLLGNTFLCIGSFQHTI